MRYFSISEVLDRAWELTKRHGIIVVLLYILIKIGLSFVGNVFSPPVDVDAITSAVERGDYTTMLSTYYSNPFGTIIMWILGIIVMLGFTKSLLLLAKEEATSIEFSTWSQPVKVYVNYTIVTMIVNILCGFGYVCCIIPGLFLSGRLMLAPYYVLDHPDCDILEPITKSWEMTSGNSANLMLFILVQIFLIIVGFICCCVGVFVAAVICEFAEIEAYLVLSGYYDNKPEEAATVE